MVCYCRACENGHLDIVEFLLTKGAMVQVHPVTGYSPLHAACHTGNVQCAQAVLQVRHICNQIGYLLPFLVENIVYG